MIKQEAMKPGTKLIFPGLMAPCGNTIQRGARHRRFSYCSSSFTRFATKPPAVARRQASRVPLELRRAPVVHARPSRPLPRLPKAAMKKYNVGVVGYGWVATAHIHAI